MTDRKNDHRSRKINRLKDEVYREMFRLEGGRPGAEMGLALALLRAWLAVDIRIETATEWEWLKTICPICLKMIEESLDRGSTVAAMLLKACDAKPV